MLLEAKIVGIGWINVFAFYSLWEPDGGDHDVYQVQHFRMLVAAHHKNTRQHLVDL
jgi:hypothetical protein